MKNFSKFLLIAIHLFSDFFTLLLKTTFDY